MVEPADSSGGERRVKRRLSSNRRSPEPRFSIFGRAFERPPSLLAIAALVIIVPLVWIAMTPILLVFRGLPGLANEKLVNWMGPLLDKFGLQNQDR